VPQYGRLKINTERGGEVREVIQFLSALEDAYNNLYALDFISSNAGDYRRRYRDFSPYSYTPHLGLPLDVEGLILPEDRLNMTSVVIESPGFWEFLGTLNPLLQLREYLKDRHERRKDNDYREGYESERLELENEQQRLKNEQLKTEIIRERIRLLDEAGFDPEERRRLLIQHAIEPLRQLDKHINQKLISDASVKKEDGTQIE
jgi:hypothetical protein